MTRSLALLALTLTGCLMPTLRHSDEAVASLRVPPPPIKRTGASAAMPSGLRVVTFEVAGQRHVALRLALRYGEIDDPAGKEGLAALVATAALNAPIGAGGARLEERLFALGAWDTVRLGPDELVLSVACRPAQLAEVVAALGALLDGVDRRIDDEAVAAARRELVARAEQERDGADRLHRGVVARALAGTPYGRPPASAEALAGLTVADVRAAAREAFRPARAVLVASGGGAAEALYRSVTGAFPAQVVGTRAAPEFPVDPPAVAGLRPRPHGALETVVTSGGSPFLWLAWPVPGAREGQELVEVAAAMHLERRLRRHARNELSEEVESLRVWPSVMDGASVLVARVGLKDARAAERVLIGLTDATDDVESYASGADYALAGQDAAYLKVAAGLIEDEARCYRVSGEADALGRQQAQARELARSLRPFLKTWVAPGPSVALLSRPEQADAPLPDEAGGRAVRGLADRHPFAAAAPGAAEVTRLLEAPGLSAAHREPLPGGAQLVVLPRPGPPLVVGRTFLPGGAVTPAEAPAADSGLDVAQRKLWQSGCWGASQPSAWAEGVALKDGAPQHRLRWLVESMGCWTGAEKDWAQLRFPRASGDWRVRLAWDALLTGGPAPVPGALPDVDAFGRGYLARALQPTTAAVILTGQVTPSPALSQVAAQAFAGWGRADGEAAPAASPPPPPLPAARRVILVDVPGAKRAEVRVAVRAPERAPTIPADDVLLDVVWDHHRRGLLEAGLGGDLGWSIARGAAFLTLRAVGPRERTVPALERMLAELGAAAEAIPAAAAVDVARWEVARREAYDHDTAQQAADALVEQAAYGLPADYHETYPAALAAVTPAAVHAAVRALAVGKEAVLVVGDAATLKPLLTARGLAPEVVGPAPRRD